MGAKPETHTKIQMTQHGCLPSLLGDGDKGIEILYREGKKHSFYCEGYSSRGKSKISCTGTTSPTNQPWKDLFHLSSLSSSLFQQSAWGHPSLVSLSQTLQWWLGGVGLKTTENKIHWLSWTWIGVDENCGCKIEGRTIIFLVMTIVSHFPFVYYFIILALFPEMEY